MLKSRLCLKKNVSSLLESGKAGSLKVTRVFELPFVPNEISCPQKKEKEKKNQASLLHMIH